MKKRTKHWFLRQAVIRTLILAGTLMVTPWTSSAYKYFVGKEIYNETWGYPVAGTVVLIIMSLVLTIRYYVLAFDKDERKKYNNED